MDCCLYFPWIFFLFIFYISFLALGTFDVKMAIELHEILIWISEEIEFNLLVKLIWFGVTTVVNEDFEFQGGYGFLIVNMIKGRVGWVISCPISEFQPPKWLQQPFSKWKNDTMSNRLRRVNKENGSQLHWLKNETVHVIRTRIYIW